VVRQFSDELKQAQKAPPRLLLTGGRRRYLLGVLTRSLLAGRSVSALALEDGLALRGAALRALSEEAAAQPSETTAGPAAPGATAAVR
jgi:hypothetical protein